jgi:hypothetical protein
LYFFGQKFHDRVATRWLRNACLEQWCPTLSPFAACGDRKLFRNRFVVINKPNLYQILQVSIQSGDSITLVATFVVGHYWSRASTTTTVFWDSNCFSYMIIVSYFYHHPMHNDSLPKAKAKVQNGSKSLTYIIWVASVENERNEW